ncbi:FG-GAP repeat domain-containing protein [Aliiglaciecola aliphaticivorans]
MVHRFYVFLISICFLTVNSSNVNADVFGLQFSEENIAGKTFVYTAETQPTFTPRYFETISFHTDHSASVTKTYMNGEVPYNESLTWVIDDGELVLESGIASSSVAINYSYTFLSDIWGSETAAELFSLYQQGIIEQQLEIKTNLQTVYTIASDLGNEIEIIKNDKTIYTFVLPENVDFSNNRMGVVENSSAGKFFTSIKDDMGLFNESNIIGKWAIPYTYSINSFYNGSEPEASFTIDEITLSIGGTASTHYGDEDLTWQLSNGALSIISGDKTVVYNPFMVNAKEYVVFIQELIAEEVQFEIVSTIAKFDDSYSLLTENLITDFPLVYNSDINSHNASYWQDGIRKLESGCCFAHQFLDNGEVRFGITASDDQFRLPYLSDYAVSGNKITINRYLDGYFTLHERVWSVISVDEYGRALVVDSDYVENEFSEGFNIKPRIGIYSLVNLSDYPESYNNTERPYDTDSDFDGVLDTFDEDDDNDGITDSFDAFPVDPNEHTDTDSDGIGNNADPDDDNDGVLDEDDAAPLNPLISVFEPKNDVDGDGKSDLLWRSEARGWNYLWAMDGVKTKLARPINVVQGAGWLMAGQGDYNDDGMSDILWRNTLTGQNFIYLMEGLSIKARQVLNYVSAPQWEIRGSGDFNGDGKGDVMWRRVDRGDTWFYMMDGLSIGVNQPSLWVTDLNYKIAAIGDINGDGTDDVIWRNQVTGINYIWVMEDGEIANRYVLNTINGDWTIAGSGDLDGDGTDDIVLRNQVDGRNWAYLMEDGQVKTSQLINTVGDTNWQIANMGDYDGDGKTDILWRNEKDARNLVHLMSGLTIKDRGVLRSTDDTWSLAK